MIDGEMDAGAWSCGMVVGLIKDVPTVKELIDRIMADAERIILDRLAGFLGGRKQGSVEGRVSPSRCRTIGDRQPEISDLAAAGAVEMAEGRIEIDTGTSELLCEIRDRVAVITLNRPEARNALSDHLTPALRRMIKQCGDDPNVGALLITGAGTAFCAGGDVKGMGNNSNKEEIAFEERVADLQNQAAHLDRCAGGGAKADDRSASGTRGRRRDGACARLRYPHCRRIRDHVHRICPHRIDGRLRHRVAIDPAGRNIAGAGTDVPVGTDRRPPLRGARSRQPRGARR